MARFEGGYIKWHRKAFFGDIGSNIHCLGIWIALLSMANWKSSVIIWKGERRTLPPGAMVVGLRELAERLDCSKDTVSRWLAYLMKTERITVEHSTRGSLVTVLNWETYQSTEPDDETLARRDQDADETLAGHDAPPTVGQQPTLNEEVKKERKEEEKKESRAPTREQIQECVKVWGETLQSFGVPASEAQLDEAQIFRLIATHGLQPVSLALLGARHEEKSETFNPAKHVSIERLWKPSNFSKFRKLGSQAKAKEAERQAVRAAIDAQLDNARKLPESVDQAKEDPETVKNMLGRWSKGLKSVPRESA